MISKRVRNAVFPLLACLAGTAMAQGAPLRMGLEPFYPPFESKQADGQLVGFDIDVAKALCEEMKVTCEFVTQDWDGIIPALQAKKFDAIIASMSITPERLEKVDFSKKYYNTPPAVAVPKRRGWHGIRHACRGALRRCAQQGRRVDRHRRSGGRRRGDARLDPSG